MSDPLSSPTDPAHAVTVGSVSTAPDAPAGRISRADVAHLARLARLAVTDDELDVFAGQLDVILGAVARVGEVATATATTSRRRRTPCR